jgi:hypothetical protein
MHGLYFLPKIGISNNLFTKRAYFIRTYWSFRVLDLIPMDENVGIGQNEFFNGA